MKRNFSVSLFPLLFGTTFLLQIHAPALAADAKLMLNASVLNDGIGMEANVTLGERAELTALGLITGRTAKDVSAQYKTAGEELNLTPQQRAEVFSAAVKAGKDMREAAEMHAALSKLNVLYPDALSKLTAGALVAGRKAEDAPAILATYHSLDHLKRITQEARAELAAGMMVSGKSAKDAEDAMAAVKKELNLSHLSQAKLAAALLITGKPANDLFDLYRAVDTELNLSTEDQAEIAAAALQASANKNFVASGEDYDASVKACLKELDEMREGGVYKEGFFAGVKRKVNSYPWLSLRQCMERRAEIYASTDKRVGAMSEGGTERGDQKPSATEGKPDGSRAQGNSTTVQ